MQIIWCLVPGRTDRWSWVRLVRIQLKAGRKGKWDVLQKHVRGTTE